ncbi:MAG: VOC family protein [Gammaproteobacteria bacterium]|nr:VOC family protein [Gammaproteobacteria bacterium]MCW8911175.1 VOC family protein [Gammaproteobacteria bacterium]MCW9006023.1 VOC family protein [Gammaproteobacteria bacterium]MCW9056634.1 VOC family protein [Gammaproteobacteria bacterium]
MAVLSIHHVSLLVENTEKSLQFYIGILGLEVDASRPDLGYPGAWINIGNQQIHLLELPNPDSMVDRPEHGGRDRHLAVLVDDIAAIETRLEQSNITFTRSRSGRKAIFCRDYDGNALEVIE